MRSNKTVAHPERLAKGYAIFESLRHSCFTGPTTLQTGSERMVRAQQEKAMDAHIIGSDSIIIGVKTENNITLLFCY